MVVMKRQLSEFERGRRIVLIFVILAVVLGVAALMFTKEDSREQMILVIAAFVCVAAVVISARLFCRCPHCGKRIVNGVLVLKVCPRCKHSLITGKKA